MNVNTDSPRRALLYAAAGVLLAALFVLALLLGPVAGVAARPAATVRHVAPGGNCGGAPQCYASPQAAVDAAVAGDEIRIAAGTYTGVSTRAGRTQLLDVGKPVTIRGGYRTSDWNRYDPVANLTTLDAQQQARVLDIRGDIAVTLAGLRITGGMPHHVVGGSDIGSSGGGIYVLSATVTMLDNVISGNTAGIYPYLLNGGGVYLNYATTILTHNRIVSNTATGNGAGLYLWNGRATLDGNTLSGNDAGGDGGGLYMVSNPATLTANTFSGNHAGGEGGGTSMEDSAASLSSNTFASNTAGTGGGLSLSTHYLWSSRNATLSGNTFVSNSASYGGGLNLNPGTRSAYGPPPVTLVGNTIQGNSASWDGGGVTAASDGEGLVLTNNTISGNEAQYDGAGLNLSGGGPLTLTRNTIVGNRSTEQGGHGGGICFVSSRAVLAGDIISGNVASLGGGGGLYLDGSPAMVAGVRILGNTASEAVYLDESDATFVNTVIADNLSNLRGCTSCYGVTVIRSSPRFSQVTLAHNAGVAAISLSDWNEVYSHVALTNTIIVSHALGIMAAAGNGATLNGILWYGNTRNYGDGDIVVSNATTGDPRFALDGYHILSGSAAIGHGVIAGVATDIDGQPRPNPAKSDHKPDLGADEWYPVVVLRPLYLPLIERQAISAERGRTSP